MCKYCDERDGELGTPLIHTARRLGPIYVDLDVWVWNRYNIGALWYTVDIAGEPFIDGKFRIRNCPVCGRDLEVI